MAKVYLATDLPYFVGGQLQFATDRVELFQLVEYAEEIAGGPDGVQYRTLHARRSSPKEFCIEFVYELTEISDEVWKTLKENLIQSVIQRFGEAKRGGSYSGYSFSRSVMVIK